MFRNENTFLKTYLLFYCNISIASICKPQNFLLHQRSSNKKQIFAKIVINKYLIDEVICFQLFPLSGEMYCQLRYNLYFSCWRKM